MAGYPNGDPRNAPARALGAAFSAAAAGALLDLNRAYRARWGTDIGVVEGFRSYDEQARLYEGWLQRRPGYNLAAPPGQSRHGDGAAADLAHPLDEDWTPEHQWLREHGPAYGWEWTGRYFGEAWHFDFTGIGVDADRMARYERAGLAVPDENEYPMVRYRDTATGTEYAVHRATGKQWQIPSPAFAGLLVAMQLTPPEPADVAPNVLSFGTTLLSLAGAADADMERLFEQADR